MNNLTQNEKFLLNILESTVPISAWMMLQPPDRESWAENIQMKYKFNIEWFIIACKLGLVTQEHFQQSVRYDRYKEVEAICRYTDLNPNAYYMGDSPMSIASRLKKYEMLKLLIRKCGGNPFTTVGNGIPPYLQREIYKDSKVKQIFDEEMSKIKQDQHNTRQVFGKTPLSDVLDAYLESGSTQQRSQIEPPYANAYFFNSHKRSKKQSRKRSKKQSRKRSKKQTRKRSKKQTRKQTRKQSRKRRKKSKHKKSKSKKSKQKTSKQRTKQDKLPAYLVCRSPRRSTKRLCEQSPNCRWNGKSIYNKCDMKMDD